jgi:fimbrial chaperone protein
MKNPLATTLLCLLMASLAAPVWAAPFAINPVRIYMTPKDKAVAVTITNEGDEALVMQADLYRWTQTPDGEDVLEPTEEVFLTPPIIKLAGKSRQVVRLARLRPLQQAGQLTYRLIVREIPEAKPSQENLRVQIALAFSLPVFITPPNAKYQLACTAVRSTADTLRTSCSNSGNAYAQLINFVVTGPGGETLAGRDTGGYILPTAKRSFDLNSPGGAIPAGKAQLTVKLDDGSQQTFDITLSE